MPRAMASLDLVETVMLIEEILEPTKYPTMMQKGLAAQRKSGTGLNFTCQTDGRMRKLPLSSERLPRFTTPQSWLRA